MIRKTDQFSDGRRGRIEVMAALLYAWLWCLASLSCAGRPQPPSRQKLEVEKHLKRLNKPPVKTIQSSDGDLIDCVHISHQPAFDHPFLKDHQIQMRPSYHPEGLFGDEKEKKKMPSAERKTPIAQLWHANGACPEGTIPIRRTKEEDVMRASSVKGFGKKKHPSIPKPEASDTDPTSPTAHQHAIAYVGGDRYYGTKATINVWEPIVEEANEFSLSQIWILGGSLSDHNVNSIEAGWQVSPLLYGDSNTRLFTYWTSDAYQATGCYNLLCSAFVQTSPSIALGASIHPVSAFGGLQYEITILIWKEPRNGNWWMQLGDNEIMGYWPSSLFSHLAESASMIQWGGEIVNTKPKGHHTSTQMGSGQFPEQGFGHSSYFKKIQVVDSSNNFNSPKLETYTDQSNCYDIQAGRNDDWGRYFYYGGRGSTSICP